MTVKKVKHLFEHWNSKCDLWHSYDADRLKRTSCLQLKDIQQCWAIPKMHLVLRGGSSIFFLTGFPFSAVSGRRKRERGGSEKKKQKFNTPSASTSLIMSCSSASVGFCPSDLITVPSSLVVMVPSPSLSNSENASLNSTQTIYPMFVKVCTLQ